MIQAAPGFVILKPEEVTQTSGGVLLPDQGEQPAIGRVLDVGAPRVSEYGKVIESPVMKDELVVHTKYQVEELNWQGVKYRLARFENIMAIVNEETNEQQETTK